MTISVDINLDTPIYQLTPRQLFEMQKEYMALVEPKEEPKSSEYPRYINNVEELAKFLGTSKSYIYKMKSEGLLDGTFSQHGKWIVFDVDAIIEKFKENPKRCRKQW